MIGEQFDYGDEICGAVVSVRGKQERIAIWTKNAANEAAQVFTVECCDDVVSNMLV
jgi:translation initiation factor 4E